MGTHLPVSFLSNGGTPLFFTVSPDWWFSMASTFIPGEDPMEVGRMVYTPRWRGSRNLFRERMYVTASSRMKNILPASSAPTAMYVKQAGQRIWPPVDDPTQPLLKLRPVEPEWEDRLIVRDTEGEWRPYPDGDGVILKTALAEEVMMSRLTSSRMDEPLRDILYPELTAYGPWRFTDFDNRMVGAGTFAQTYAEIGALLQQVEAERGGPTFGTGGAELFWSGLVSGFVPDFTDVTIWKDPWIPHLAWNSISKHSRLLGMGDLESFRDISNRKENRLIWMDRSLATQVAYGAPGRLPSKRLPEWKVLHMTRLIRALQDAITGQTAERIAYWNGDAFTDLAGAFADGSIARNQIYIRLTDQTEIWVNGALDQTWSRRVSGTEWQLPPFGFLVRGPEHFIAHQPSEDGSPGVIFVDTPEGCWFSNPHSLQERGGMAFTGCIRITREGEGDYRLDILQWGGEAVFSSDRIPLNQIKSLRAVDRNGQRLSSVNMIRTQEGWILQSPDEPATVWISDEVQGGDRNLSP
jgi:hypothetical protein